MKYFQPAFEILDTKLVRQIALKLFSYAMKFSKENKKISIRFFYSNQYLFSVVVSQEHMLEHFLPVSYATTIKDLVLELPIVKQHGQLKEEENS